MDIDWIMIRKSFSDQKGDFVGINPYPPHVLLLARSSVECSYPGSKGNDISWRLFCTKRASYGTAQPSRRVIAFHIHPLPLTFAFYSNITSIVYPFIKSHIRHQPHRDSHLRFVPHHCSLILVFQYRKYLSYPQVGRSRSTI